MTDEEATLLHRRLQAAGLDVVYKDPERDRERRLRLRATLLLEAAMLDGEWRQVLLDLARTYEEPWTENVVLAALDARGWAP